MRRRRVEIPSPGEARSFWLQEALAADPGEPVPVLAGRHPADVCVVGGGFAGLWTAVELSRREPSMRIALVEADICGGGASGRNGGFLSSSWWDLAAALCRIYGDDAGVRYATVVAEQVADVGRWLTEHDVEAWFHHEGVLGARTGAWQGGGAVGGDVAFVRRMGVEERMVPLSVEECRAFADSPRFVGGHFIADSATVQPARLARGLRRVALRQGVTIFERSPVVGVERGRPAIVRTEGGAIRADQVVLTIGAWAAGWRRFRRSFGTIADYMVATEPIPNRLEQIG